ncbi:MAG TPA: hypothetical protein VF543_02915 [Pyrinomonadaceae bacterium]|jgi:hypothetical protein
MSDHDYTPEQALETLLRKVGERDPILAERIRIAIDAGKDISETEVPRTRKQKPRTYRRKVAYSHKEALAVALGVLRSHFIELPLFINSAAANFAEAAIGIPEPTRRQQAIMSHGSDALILKGAGEPKQLQIELQTETQLSNVNEDTLNMEPVAEGLIEEEQANLRRLEELTSF